MAQGKLPVPGRPTIWITVGQGPTALAVGAGGGCLDIFTLIYHFSPLSPSLWETARYRLQYCLKGPLNPKQPTNQNSIFCQPIYPRDHPMTSLRGFPLSPIKKNNEKMKSNLSPISKQNSLNEYGFSFPNFAFSVMTSQNTGCVRVQ